MLQRTWRHRTPAESMRRAPLDMATTLQRRVLVDAATNTLTTPERPNKDSCCNEKLPPDAAGCLFPGLTQRRASPLTVTSCLSVSAMSSFWRRKQRRTSPNTATSSRQPPPAVLGSLFTTTVFSTSGPLSKNDAQQRNTTHSQASYA